MPQTIEFLPSTQSIAAAEVVGKLIRRVLALFGAVGAEPPPLPFPPQDSWLQELGAWVLWADRATAMLERRGAEIIPFQRHQRITTLDSAPDGRMSPTAYRKQVRVAGFSPVPADGKAAAPRLWQKLADASEDEIELWERIYPRAGNTGILTKFAPAFDIDIKDPEAAAAVERLVSERFEGFPVRFGQAPKRAVLFRTDAPFAKIKYVFGEPDTPEKDCEKLEFMGDGQQLVIDGIHPVTHQPYSWHGGKPGEDIKRQDLPEIHNKEEAAALAKDCAALLVDKFGYKLRSKPKAKKANGEDTGTELRIRGAESLNRDDLAIFSATVFVQYIPGSNPSQKSAKTSLLLPISCPDMSRPGEQCTSV